MRLPIVLAGMMLGAAALPAQTIERPQAFDSAQRIVAISPAVAERLRLTPPLWPAQGEYREARLYSVEPTGGFVLVVQEPSGALRRFTLSDAQRVALRETIDAGMSASGRPTAESATDVISVPAGNAFARDQTVRAAVLYGPLAASLADDEAGAAALYLAVTGGTFFASYAAAQSNQFTRAQSALAGDLGFASAVNGWLLGYAATGDSEKGVRAASFLSAVAGTIAGASLGRRLSDAEAHAAYLGIESVAAATLALSSGVGPPSRGTAATVALFSPAGYVLGVQYPRRASYNVTAGDVESIGTTGLIGGLAAAALLGQVDNASDRQVAGFLASGFLGGALLGELTLARRQDLSEAQANVLNIGAGAGALLGAAIPALAGSGDQFALLGAATVGAVLGVSALASSFRPNTASRSNARFRTAVSRGPVRLAFRPLALLGAVSGTPGRHALARLTF